ncbi:hypothetical protein AAFC00_005193 [Neodothiora populina]|uniref:Cell division cycle protein 123 n=1 Tax=Neodothiora populina TaxID=2781224 RepID=A0ABR3PK33_9PEZI
MSGAVSADVFESDAGGSTQPLTELPFPPLTKAHIIHCSYHYWHPKYRTITPKARLIPLSRPFLDYLRADGIILPPENEPRGEDSDDEGFFSSTDNPDEQDEEEDDDPSREWHDVHEAIKATIAELGGKVVPKLNWSAPKDATWMTANTMECRDPNDIYLLLKSSDFVTHDLEHAYDDTVDDPTDDDEEVPKTIADIPYHLALRKYVLLNPSVEFRCFVRRRKLIAICQRDLNHFDFLSNMQDKLRDSIQDFFDAKLKNTFPDESFAFDVYIPPPHDRVWLIDVNPWAQRTDPLLFSWLELLTMPEPPEVSQESAQIISIPFRPRASGPPTVSASSAAQKETEPEVAEEESEGEESEEEADEELWVPEFRLVKKDDPEAYSFTTPQYSAHKLPRDVVDASQGGPGALREFADNWKEMLAKRQQEDENASDSEQD